MKKIISLLLSFVLLLVMCSMGVSVSAEESEIIVNVKDFGAVGDGKTNDQGAMLSAFSYAISNYASKSIPVTVYFPEGEYGLLRGGMYINLPFGSGNLTVRGDGADKSTIVYLEEWTTGGSWVALRLQLEKDPLTTDDYLHDIIIEDLGVYDTDPVNHAWHPDKGDPGKEETHGFNIQHCVRATIQNCKVDSVGDEAIDMSHCIDSEMVDNLVINSPGAGSGGGGISVGDESKNVRIANNVISGSISGTTNWAIAVEALTDHVEDIVIVDNIIQGINGYGINIGAPAGTIKNVLIQNNEITDCRDGGIRLFGSGQTDDVQLLNNIIKHGSYGIYLEGDNKDCTLIENCIIENTASHGIKIDSPNSNDTIVCDSVIRNSQFRAIYNAGTNTKINRVLIDGVGLAGNVTTGAITQYVPGEATTSCSEVVDTVVLNCQNKKGLQGVQRIINTYIDQAEISGYTSISGASVIRNCRVNRIIQAKSGCTIDNMVFDTEAELGTHAITLSGLTDCTITKCVFVMPSRNAVREYGTANRNMISDNVIVGGYGISTLGANTVVTGNATGSIASTDTFRYCIADGKVTIIEALDTTITELVIPATIDGCPVVRIAPWAFGLCDQLTSVQYQGTRAEWDKMDVGACNDSLLDATLRCYSDRYSETVRHSVMDTDNGNGLAFRFELSAYGVGVVQGNRLDVTDATINYMGVECKLVGMGAVVTNNGEIGAANLSHALVNGGNVVDIPAVYMQEVEADYCVFAVRIINIPSTAVDVPVYVRPYYVIEVDGEQLTIYDSVNVASCADFM